MSITDPIADMLTIIRNASRVKKEKADVRSSRLVKEILRILKQERYIKDYKQMEGDKRFIRVYLKYGKNDKPAIINLKKISKPGLRKYTGSKKIPVVLGGAGIAIVSTSKGVLADSEAREGRIGGEVLCYVW